jgi:hypothetical protein
MKLYKLRLLLWFVFVSSYEKTYLSPFCSWGLSYLLRGAQNNKASKKNAANNDTNQITIANTGSNSLISLLLSAI